MFVTIRKWTAVYILTIMALFTCVAVIIWRGTAVNASRVQDLVQRPVLVIDAGHGGMDGGAVAEDGTRESQINLDVALKTEQVAGFLGIPTVMTRREDISLHSEDATTIRQQKNSDLKNRAAMVNATPGAFLLSIHQNTLQGMPSVHGGQVFYNGKPGGEHWAQEVQASLNEIINEGAKDTRRGGGDIYLLDRSNCPGILVECGFLSNASEAKLLKDPRYQLRLALILAGATARAMTWEGEGATS